MGGQVHPEAEAGFLRLDRQHTFPGSWSQCHGRIGDTGRLPVGMRGYKIVSKCIHLGPSITYRYLDRSIGFPRLKIKEQ